MATPIFPGRYMAPNDHEFVLFRIGMRFNGWRGLGAALQTFARMPSMLAEQQADQSIGMLSSSISLSWPVVQITQVWRSFDDLERYATTRDGLHTKAWRWFNKLGRRGVGAGVWHETFRIAPHTYEAIYINMPRYGIAAATAHEPVSSRQERARERIAGVIG